MSDCLTDEAEKEVEMEQHRLIVDVCRKKGLRPRNSFEAVEQVMLFSDYFLENILLTQLEALEQGKKAMVNNLITTSEKKYKTAPITLSQEAIEAQYGKTMTETAAALEADDLPQENILLPQPEALEQGKKAMVNNRITTSEKKYKTAPITLSQEAIEAQYGKTMTEAVAALEADDFQENILLPQPEALEQGKKAMVKNRITRTAPITLSQEAIEAQYVKTMTEAAAVLEEEFFNRRQRLLEEYEEEEETREELFNKVRDYLFYEEEQRQIVDMCYTVNPVEVKKALKMFAFVISALFKVENHPEAVSLPLGKADDFQETTLSVEDILLPQPEASEQGKKAMVKIRITASEKKYKTAEIPLYKKDIEAQYGKTMSEAAKALGVSLSTLKRKRKDAGISEWQGPSSTKRKVNNSSNQSAKNEEYDGAVQDSSPINKNENTLTIKAKYKEDTIKIYLCISEATFIIVEEKIGKKCNLTHGTYKLNYLDEDEEWILLASDEDMSDCMKSSRILGQNVVRLRVLPIPC